MAHQNKPKTNPTLRVDRPYIFQAGLTLEVIGRQTLVGIEARTQSIPDKLVQKVTPGRVIILNRCSKIETADQQFTFTNRHFEQIGFIQKPLRHIDTPHDRFDLNAKLIKQYRLAALDELMELQVAPSFVGHISHRGVLLVDDGT